MSKEYKSLEQLKEELGDKFEEYMYKANIELLNKIDKAIEYINYMFDKANENDIIDDLLKIENILRGKDNE